MTSCWVSTVQLALLVAAVHLHVATCVAGTGDRSPADDTSQAALLAEIAALRAERLQLRDQLAEYESGRETCDLARRRASGAPDRTRGPLGEPEQAADAMRRRQQRAESYLQDLERLMEASTQLVARTPRSGPLNMDTKFGVDMLLLSAKHTMVAALEIDGGAASTRQWSRSETGDDRLFHQRAARWSGLLSSFRSISETLNGLVAAGRVADNLGGFFPFTTQDVSEFVDQVCGAYPSLRPEIRGQFAVSNRKGEKIPNLMPRCEKADEAGEAELPFRLGSVDTFLANAPLVGPDATAHLGIDMGEGPASWTSAVQTRQLWPTLISTLDVKELGLKHAPFGTDLLDRLNAAAIAGYANFLTSNHACRDRVDCDNNDEFFLVGQALCPTVGVLLVLRLLIRTLAIMLVWTVAGRYGRWGSPPATRTAGSAPTKRAGHPHVPGACSSLSQARRYPG